MSSIQFVTIVVSNYDEAIEFFVDVLGFELIEDTPTLSSAGHAKRWVVVRPPGAETGVVLAQADGEGQRRIVGRQSGGRVGFFLKVDDFELVYSKIRDYGVEIETPARHEPYGTVAVFSDIAGNRWDLIGST